jgi:hypothetical protein
VKHSEKMRLGVRSEVNYLDATTDARLGPEYDDCLQFDCLRWMAGVSDEKFQCHYIETFNAGTICAHSSNVLHRAKVEGDFAPRVVQFGSNPAVTCPTFFE